MQGGGVVRLAVRAVTESAVAAREDDWCRPEPLGHGGARAAGEHHGRLRPDADDDANRRRAERVVVGVVSKGSMAYAID